MCVCVRACARATHLSVAELNDGHVVVCFEEFVVEEFSVEEVPGARDCPGQRRAAAVVDEDGGLDAVHE